MLRISLIIIPLLLILTGCSSTNAIEKEEIVQDSQYQDWRFLKALIFFSNSEYERLQGNYDTAFDLVRLAEESYPESVYLKEKIYNYLRGQAQHDSTAADYMIKLGSKWYKDGVISSEILYSLAEICVYRNQIELADIYFLSSLTEGAKRSQYLTYYMFQREYYPPADSVYLRKAAAGEWKEEDKGVIYQVVDQYNSLGEEEKARDLLLRAYKSWHELQPLLNIIALNVKLEDWDLTAELLSDRQDNEGDLPRELLDYLISLYYETGKYDKVVELETECRETGNEMIMKILFLSALQVDDYELSNKTADLLVSAGFISEDYYPSFYGSLWELELKERHWERALERFNQAGGVINKLSLIIEKMNDEANIELLEVFLESYYQEAEAKQEALFILAIFNLKQAKWQRGEELLELIDNSYILNEELIVVLAAVYSEDEAGFLESKFRGDSLLLGLLYFYLQDVEKAALFLEDSYTAGKINPQGLLALGTILNDKADEDHLIAVLEYGRENFGENTNILNFYGYQVAVQEEEELYETAETSLLKALELEPENAMYWDSLGWLYYKMNKMESALEAMDHTIEIATQHADIAYHLGAILYENKEYDLAQAYLLMVNDMEGGEELQEKVQEILNKLKVEE
ncbi:MAG: hypothetical protein K9M99_00805 [Candidatus Cloacimonetes bacterium]|nr:hypothetical protein [Candidatus Cloacimonadota bacterium]